ncbi:MAG: hypothetical protein C0490_12690 [Marivirga sp.]|nr:hypothetical protein [Marivirga sp.]
MKDLEGIVVKVIESVICRFIFLLFSFSSAVAGESISSGKNDILDNPNVSVGINRDTGMVTGFLVGLRTAPGRTDECRLVFAGSMKDPNTFSVKYLSEADGYSDKGSTSPAVVDKNGGDLQIRMKKDQMGGDCEWILPFADGSRIEESDSEVAVNFGKIIPGDWIGVFVIASKRASFYRTTEQLSVQNSFLIQGDLIYVYDEKPGWYYVKYQGEKKLTTGWIMKKDTVQIAVN